MCFDDIQSGPWPRAKLHSFVYLCFFSLFAIQLMHVCEEIIQSYKKKETQNKPTITNRIEPSFNTQYISTFSTSKSSWHFCCCGREKKTLIQYYADKTCFDTLFFLSIAFQRCSTSLFLLFLPSKPKRLRSKIIHIKIAFLFSVLFLCVTRVALLCGTHILCI